MNAPAKTQSATHAEIGADRTAINGLLESLAVPVAGDGLLTWKVDFWSQHGSWAGDARYMRVREPRPVWASFTVQGASSIAGAERVLLGALKIMGGVK